MDIQGIGLFRMISQQLRWLGQRQEVLSQNLANSDTPGYQARDIEPMAFGDALRQERRHRHQRNLQRPIRLR